MNEDGLNFIHNLNDPEYKRDTLSINEEVYKLFNSTGATLLNNVYRKHFTVGTEDIITISTDEANPTIITGLFDIGTPFGFSLDETLGAVKNNHIETLDKLIGSFSFQAFIVAGGSKELTVWSERSPDGINWFTNPGSLRLYEFTRPNETFKSSISLAVDLEPANYLRFLCYTPDGDIEIRPAERTINGEVKTGLSFAWSMSTP